MQTKRQHKSKIPFHKNNSKDYFSKAKKNLKNPKDFFVKAKSYFDNIKKENDLLKSHSLYFL